MDKTFGGNRGITPSISKRVKRQVIRYNRDDYVSNTTITHKKGYGQYEDISRAKVADLVYYFGKSWIDWECVDIPESSREAWRARKGRKVKELATSEVFRCLKCKRAYETRSMTSGGKVVGDRYLNASIFNNVPLVKKDCDSCG